MAEAEDDVDAYVKQLAEELFRQVQNYRLVLNDDSTTFYQAALDAPFNLPRLASAEQLALAMAHLLEICEQLDEL